jgi:HD-like signal output (HDOD) protein
MTSQSSLAAAPEEFQGRLRSGKDWREVVAMIGDLPPMPHVASRAIQMVENPDTNGKKIAEVLSSDTALTARVLKIANSALFARQKEITTLSQAVMIIGLKALKGIIVAAAVRQVSKKGAGVEKLVWENSLATAMASFQLCKHLGKRYLEESFLLGMLHSLGQVALLSSAQTSDIYPNVISRMQTENCDFVSAEEELFGFGHPLIGALVAKKWNFNDETCQVILHCKDPIINSTPDSETEVKGRLIQLAHLISLAAGIGLPEGCSVSIERIEEVALYIGFPDAGISDVISGFIEDTKERFEKERHVYEGA